ncbi:MULTISPECIES: fumarylacetoacetate hydrolase family protein [Ensifer]|uniref:fumarylacetoacetate hydrolase family protein n=1 Tax=Ensifer TaxID=106591 RepID=UPI000715E7E1|nr:MULTISPECIES: fumarylacetoacetate hydrolase family protein [Ensifer]KQX15221.1 hydrolase [Ensifer sp. Root423]QHG74707.1 fumarylacetoacetate hydrolase family protein [Ensifer adhaerens]
MKVARFSNNGKVLLGVVNDAAGTVHPFDSNLTSMADLIRFSASGFSFTAASGPGLPLSEVTLVAPIIPERNIFCVGKNYYEHAKEFAGSGFEAGAVKGQEIDAYPAIFSKPPSTVIGPDAVVEMHPQATQAVDYEAELAIVVGQPGRNIAEADAMQHVWGYTIVNDVTARDRQRNHKQWLAGKGLDTFCPMGPWIVTADEIDGANLDIECKVNGEVRQKANTSDLIFKIPQLIAAISAGLTLQPGDVIATGTPAGVGIGFTPPRFLKAGDRVEITISGIGSLSNTFA